MNLHGKAHRFGDDVNTDYIISGRYKFKIQDPNELAKHVMEDLDPEFYKKLQKGDFLVAGKNFGCGSSREQAPVALKYAGIAAVLAKSFARIFFRNSINVGLMLLECDTDQIASGDELDIDVTKGIVYNKTKNKQIPITPLPDFMLSILHDGGLVEHVKKHGGFNFGA
ncbi:MAG: 3-isopropylmalate dehydratase small subunit [Candidatus Omnitrophica bacterium]|nr:3-isopropylmalate dehydratase small subunit [Candidatus Omnitrophota bacterium]